MSMYNLIEYNDNYSDTARSLQQFKRDESPINNAGNLADVTTNNSSSFKFKSSILGKPAVDGILKNAKIAVPLEYLGSFRQSLEMPLINCKIHLELNYTKSCLMSDNNNKQFKMTNTKLYILIVTLSTEDNAELTKQLNEGFKRPAYLDQYKTKMKP